MRRIMITSTSGLVMALGPSFACTWPAGFKRRANAVGWSQTRTIFHARLTRPYQCRTITYTKTFVIYQVTLKMEQATAARVKARVVKKGIDPEERRRKQEAHVVQIRKAKQAEQLAKRRQVCYLLAYHRC